MSLGSFILPPIVQILLNNYGLSQTFLFLSGFILNCIPAALLLKKPNFEIQRRNFSSPKQDETQNLISRTKKGVYTIKNVYNNPEIFPNCDSEVSNLYKNVSENDADLSHEERVKRSLTQTVLSGYSDQMSYSEPVRNDEIIENCSGRRGDVYKPQQEETFDLSSGNFQQCKICKKSNMFHKNTYSSNVHCQQNDKYLQCSCDNRTSSNKHNSTLDGISSQLYQNYNYQSDVKENHERRFSNSTDVIYPTKNPVFEHRFEQFSNYGSLIQGYPEEIIHTSEKIKNSPHSSLENSKLFQFPDVKDKITVDAKSEYTETKTISSLRSFSVICDPMFVLIALTTALHMYTIVCMLAIIVDFSRDLHIEESNQKYILMLLSFGDFVGVMSLGWITDRGYMSTPAFSALCFAVQGIFTAAIVWSTDFISLATLLVLYGFSGAGLPAIHPIIIDQFIEHDKQTIAIPSSHFLAGPLCLTISPLIGK